MRLILIVAALVFVLGADPPVEKDKKASPAEIDKGRGGPGATKEAQKLPQEVRNERTFTLKMPADLHVAPGTRKDVIVSLESGLSFRQRVCIYFAAPEGMRVIPAHAEIQAGDKQTTITLVADRDASAGDRTLRMIGEPETGEAVLIKVPIHVDGAK